MAASVSLLLLVAVLVVGVCGEQLFEVYEGEWDTCKRINSSSNSNCYKTRDVYCRAVASGKPAPWRHCAGRERPPRVLECPLCQQDCVVAMWSEWTPCTAGRDGEAYATRDRAVVAPPLDDGRPCPALREKKRCEDNAATIAELERSHTWKLGPWLECVPFVGDCGDGTGSRSVECVDVQGRSVNGTLCLQEEAYLNVLPPPLQRLCVLQCSCRLSQWSEWSRPTPDCTLSPPSLVRHRTRTVTQQPTLGGTPCGVLEQTERLMGDFHCPTHRWETSSWSECTVSDEGTSCGAGYRNRYTYCMEEDTDGVVTQVDPQRCNSTEEPTTLLPCEVPCVQQCIVSEWTAWSHCPNDTCETTLSHRTRDVLVEPVSFVCPHLGEVRECPPIPCTQWVPEDWSNCFPSNNQDCGWGSQSRTIRCRDAAGNTVENNLCHYPDLPNQVNLCYKHCSNDSCVISDWGEWSRCSETCGNVDGVQTRSRYVALNSSGVCPHFDGDLSREQVCSIDTPCHFPEFHVEYSEWGDCIVAPNATMDTDMCDGIRTRTSRCYEDGVPVSDSDCVIELRLNKEHCRVPCFRDCLMSDWSSFTHCSHSCTQTRSRRLLRFGGNCPSVDDHGFEIETTPCVCDAGYKWMTTDSWGTCQAFPTPLSQLSQSYVNSLIPDPGSECGQGYQTKDVVCIDKNRVIVDDTFCDIQTKPASVEACVVRCAQRCIITEWTDYSMCNGTTMMERTRAILPFSGYDNYLDNCPGLVSVAQIDGQSCPQHDFREFLWTISYEFEELHDCLLSPDKMCGPGERYRTIGCTNTSVPEDERKAASPDFCRSVRPLFLETVMPCNTHCNIDCEYAEPGWSAWSECSVTCGTGFRTRTRTIERVERGEGRPCRSINETTTCEMPTCKFYKQSYTSPSVCQPLNETLGCGEGMATSDLVCYIDGVSHANTSACEPSLGPKALRRSVSCRVPCDEDCVWSEWSALQWCPNCRSGCYKRTRHILRSASNCEGVTEQFRPCPMDEVYWEAGEWTDCIVAGSPVDDCGAGVQRRVVECKQGDKVTYSDMCSHLTKPLTAKQCSVACPVDCVVGVFGEWSSCGDCNSDLHATVTRDRRVLVQPRNRGRSCPHLVEERACPNIGCDEYFIETNSSALDCSAESTDQVCGVAAHNVLLCRKNAAYVPLEECARANVTGEVVHNSQLLDRRVDLYCDIECPVLKECEFTEFEPWSGCANICDMSLKWYQFQFQTRTLLSWWEGSWEDCHNRQLQVRLCPPLFKPTNETVLHNFRCIRFDWNTSEWFPNNTRVVQCHGDGSHVEDSACVKSLQPVSKRTSELVGVCDCPLLSVCNKHTTECLCRGGFERAGGLCLPEEGCIDNPRLWEVSQQCLPWEECSVVDSACVCPDDRECVDPSSAATPTESGFPTATVTVATGGDGTDETGTKPSDILLIALISSVPLLVFIVILLVVIIITCKCRQHLDKRQRRRRPPPVILHQNQRLNNQPDAATTKHTHDLKVGGVRIQEIPTETTSHPMHLHNGSASSGFVEEMEPFAHTSFNGYSQTQSDIDEAAFASGGNPYAPYPLHDPPSAPFTPSTPHPPYVPFQVEESDSVPYHSHHHVHGSGMRPALEPHPFSRSLSEEAHLAGIGERAGGGYDSRLEEEDPQFSQDLPEHLTHGLNYYPPSPGSSRAHPHTSHHHHGNPSSGSSGRDNRIMVGMDMSMVRAIEQMSASETGSRSPSVSSMGSRSSARRSGRRRHRHHGNHHHHHRDPRVHSPVGGPSHSAQGYYGYYPDREMYQSNTLPRSGSKTASPHMAPRHHMISEASPLVSNMTTHPADSPRYVRSASNEILEAGHRQNVLPPPPPPPLEKSHDPSHDPPVEMPPALPDEYPLVYHATNPLTTSPPDHTPRPPDHTPSQEGDYDHIRPVTMATRAPVPPPLPPVYLKPPTSTLGVPPHSTSSSSSPNSPRSPSSPSSPSIQQQFPQELNSAIQRRANALNALNSSNSSNSSPGAPPPPPRGVSGRGGRSRSGNTRFSPAMLSAYSTKTTPPPPPSRGASSLQGQTSLASNGTGAPPPPPPPPPIRSS